MKAQSAQATLSNGSVMTFFVDASIVFSIMVIITFWYVILAFLLHREVKFSSKLNL